MSKLDYLKRYMSKDEDDEKETKKKKQKKSKKQHKAASGFRIIDENAIVSSTSTTKTSKTIVKVEDDEEEDRFALEEEKPQVAGVIDERPEHVKLQERFKTTGWQTSQSNKGTQSASFRIKEEPLSPEHHRRLPKRRHDSDDSPPRKRHDSDASPARRRHDSDASPPRKRHDSDASPPRRRHDSDASPPRKRHDSDASPPRRRHGNDASPPRRRHDSDASPPRRRHDNDASPLRRRHDSDASPPRRRHDSDSSPPRKIKREVGSDEDLSPPRHIKQEGNDSDISPPRQIKQEDDGDLSPPRASSSLMSKTLSGKKAGLQDAKSLKEEMIKLKQKEKRTFDNLSSEVSGRDAETKVRGRLKEKESAEKEKRENEEKLRKELTDKFNKWNKGMKQIEDQKARVQEVLHEMDKPLARSKDDADLDVHLREIDRLEDPMLEYIRKKKEKRGQASGAAIPKYPVYRGPEPPPNRFGIRPGYRWDGVDRSNGFEKRLFERKNQRKAVAEEAYQWSIEDM